MATHKTVNPFSNPSPGDQKPSNPGRDPFGDRSVPMPPQPEPSGSRDPYRSPPATERIRRQQGKGR